MFCPRVQLPPLGLARSYRVRYSRRQGLVCGNDRGRCSAPVQVAEQLGSVRNPLRLQWEGGLVRRHRSSSCCVSRVDSPFASDEITTLAVAERPTTPRFRKANTAEPGNDRQQPRSLAGMAHESRRRLPFTSCSVARRGITGDLTSGTLVPGTAS